MAGKSDYLENGLLALIFNATTLANLANNASVGPLTDLYVSLHTGDPTDGGTQAYLEVTAGECAAYARVAVARSGAGWTVSGNSVSPAATISFPTTTNVGTGCTATHFAVGTDPSGAGHLLYAGTLTPPVVIPATTQGVIPQITTASTITED